ncbi:hypothetical protein DL764_001822 [Monosporascus ibericus]|uniref:Uncharacterized protein n=1 Tax=Monosporascus ibericus TaxID=155417 RepID=A0A4Q4TRE8_9PEZI|nr:hypothetical protein DL764_001822 [Monosporascus ibericus]
MENPDESKVVEEPPSSFKECCSRYDFPHPLREEASQRNLLRKANERLAAEFAGLQPLPPRAPPDNSSREIIYAEIRGFYHACARVTWRRLNDTSNSTNQTSGTFREALAPKPGDAFCRRGGALTRNFFTICWSWCADPNLGPRREAHLRHGAPTDQWSGYALESAAGHAELHIIDLLISYGARLELAHGIMHRAALVYSLEKNDRRPMVWHWLENYCANVNASESLTHLEIHPSWWLSTTATRRSPSCSLKLA